MTKSIRRGASAAVAPVLVALFVVAAAPPAARANEKSAPLYEDARKKLRRRDVAAAQKALEAAVAADPGDMDAQVLYQDVLLRSQPASALLPQYKAKAAALPDDPLAQYLFTRLEKPDDAARDFDKLQARFPQSAIEHEGRAIALGLLPRDATRDKDAASELDQAVTLSPRDLRIRVSIARNFERTGQWPQAADAWKFALGMRPADRSLILGYGEALRRAGVLDEAVTQFETAGKLDPTDPEPPYRIGLARRDAAKFVEAMKQFDAAIALDTGYVDAYCAAVRTSLAAVRATADGAKRDPVEADYAPAIDYGTRGVKADGQSVAAHVALAFAEEAAAETTLDGSYAAPPASNANPPANPPSNPPANPPASPPANPPAAPPAAASPHAENALREYETVLGMVPATSPDRVTALLGKAYVLLLVGKFDDAVAAADKANDSDDHAMSSYLYGGRGLQAKADSKDAIEKFYKAGLKVAPDNAKLRHAHGIALWDMGKTIDAKKDLESAAQAEPKCGRYQLSVGEIYYELKMYKQSVTALAAATELLPRDPTAWRALGRSCTSNKDFDNAALAYEQVISLVEGTPAPAGAGAGGAAPPANPPANPPTNPPANPPTSPPAPPPAGGGAAKPTDASKLAVNEHLYLALIYADHLNDKDKAKAHAKKWREEGGKNPDLESWVDQLLADK